MSRSVLSGEPTAPIDEEPSLVELRSVMPSNGTAWTELLAREIDPDEDRVDRDDDGTEFWVPLGLRLAQVLHHGTVHRSQIGTALTSLGLTPPAIDVWSVAEATGRERVVPLSPEPLPVARAGTARSTSRSGTSGRDDRTAREADDAAAAGAAPMPCPGRRRLSTIRSITTWQGAPT